MKLLGQLCPDVHSLGSQQEGEAQVKETHLDRKSKHMEVYSLSVCFFLYIVALDIKLELLPTECCTEFQKPRIKVPYADTECDSTHIT